MLLLLFTLSQLPKFEINGRLFVSYNREETNDTTNPFTSKFRIHCGTIDLSFHPTDNLDIFFSNDFLGNSGYNRFYADFFIPRLKSDINIGKFSVPFGLKLMDHESLLEDNIGLGLQREETGIGVAFQYSFFKLNSGIFFPMEDSKFRLYASTISIRPASFDIGVAFLKEHCFQNDEEQVFREYYEYYIQFKMPNRLYLIGKIIPGEMMEKSILGYHISTGYTFRYLLTPFLEYEVFDNDCDLGDNSISRITTGINCNLTPSAMIRVGYYINYEETIEYKNNLLSIMLMLMW